MKYLKAFGGAMLAAALASVQANAALVAVDDYYTISEDDSVLLQPGLNDTDVPLGSNFLIVIPPAQGSVFGSSPNYLYGSGSNYYGSDSLTYQIRTLDGVLSNIATMYISIAPVNDPPAAIAGFYSTDEDVPVAVLLQGYDVEGDALTFQIVTNPMHGTLAGSLPALVYTPNADYFGADTFTFRVIDSHGLQGIGAGMINVRPVDDPVVTPLPTALPLFATGLGVLGLIAHRQKRKQAA